MLLTVSPAFRIVVVLLLLEVGGVALAADLAVTWAHPTQNTDGSAIPATGDGALTGTRVEWGSCSGSAFGTKAGELLVPHPTASASVAGLAPGTWCVRAFARNNYGQESASSAVVAKAIAAPVPKAPTLVVVNVVAYEILPHPIEGTRLGRSIGTVPLGTGCGDEPVVGLDYHEVLREAVTLTRTPKSAVLVAKCEVTG